MVQQHFKLSLSLPFLFLFVGVILIGGSFSFFGYYWSRTAGWSQTDGTVAYYRDRLPVIQYEVDGNQFEMQGPRSDKNPLRCSDRVTVYYRPADPALGRLHSLMLQWLFPGVFGFVGMRFTFAAGRTIVQEMRRRPKNNCGDHDVVRLVLP